mgnify:CR=1 FL=1|tara:strand:- start:4605 stop:5669 length:1065 start_codon:yes stop_codon:yes gene_type:complete
MNTVNNDIIFITPTINNDINYNIDLWNIKYNYNNIIENLKFNNTEITFIFNYLDENINFTLNLNNNLLKDENKLEDEKIINLIKKINDDNKDIDNITIILNNILNKFNNFNINIKSESDSNSESESDSEDFNTLNSYMTSNLNLKIIAIKNHGSLIIKNNNIINEYINDIKKINENNDNIYVTNLNNDIFKIKIEIYEFTCNDCINNLIINNDIDNIYIVLDFIPSELPNLIYIISEFIVVINDINYNIDNYNLENIINNNSNSLVEIINYIYNTINKNDINILNNKINIDNDNKILHLKQLIYLKINNTNLTLSDNIIFIIKEILSDNVKLDNSILDKIKQINNNSITELILN